MICLTLRIQLCDLERADDAYREKFGCPPPDHIQGCRWGSTPERTKLLQEAVRTGIPLCESALGQELVRLEADYAGRFGVAPRVGLWWYADGEGGLKERIAILEASLAVGRRRLVVEYGDGTHVSEDCLPEDYCRADLLETWLDDDGQPIIIDGGL